MERRRRRRGTAWCLACRPPWRDGRTLTCASGVCSLGTRTRTSVRKTGTRSPGGLAPSCKAMSRAERAANLAGVVVPFAGVLVAIVLLWNSWVGWVDLAVLAVMYFVTAMGVTVGFHRLLTHRAFRVDPWLERSLAGL